MRIQNALLLPGATLTPLWCSPNSPLAQYLDIHTLTQELIVNYRSSELPFKLRASDVHTDDTHLTYASNNIHNIQTNINEDLENVHSGQEQTNSL